MPTKLNITPGPWQYHHKRYNTYNRESVSLGSIISGVWYIAEVQNSCNENKLSDDEESEANAAAIVTAVNNTYHKGINPEAVPEMKANLDIIIEYTFCHDSDAQKCLEHIRKLANQSLQKATL